MNHIPSWFRILILRETRNQSGVALVSINVCTRMYIFLVCMVSHNQTAFNVRCWYPYLTDHQLKFSDLCSQLSRCNYLCDRLRRIWKYRNNLMLKIFRGWYWTTKIFNTKILITQIDLWNEFFFIMWGDDAVQAHTSNLALFSYYCDAYLLITARITVHDS